MSDTRKEFLELLQNYPCSDFQTDEQNYENALIKTEWLLQHIPKKLYRFRACNNYTISAFENDEIWGTVATKQNDIMEYTPYFDWNKIYKDIDLITNNKNNYSTLLNLIKTGNPPLAIAKQFYDTDIQQMQNNIPENLLDENIVSSMNFLHKNLTAFIKQNENEFLRNAMCQIYITASRLFISCFSEENDSSYLWGNYAENNTGFCIEYDMSQYISRCLESCDNPNKCSKFHTKYQLAPVIYSLEKPDASSVLSNVIIDDISKKIGKPPKQFLFTDNNIANNLAFYKSDKWQEKEWRLIEWNHTEQYKEYNCLIKNAKPTAIYLGTKISEENQAKLIKMCKSKNLPCFKAFPNYFSSEYKYTFINVNELYNIQTYKEPNPKCTPPHPKPST